MKPVIAKVISNQEAMPGVYLTWLKAPEIAATARPGQFVMVKCGEENLLPRPFSIYLAERDTGRLGILYARVGKGTDWLAEQPENSALSILGPLGNSFTIAPEAKRLLMIAGGMGIAPLNFLAVTARERDCTVTLRQGAKTRIHVCKEEYRPARVNFIAVTEDGSAGEKGLALDCLPEALDQADQIFACGPAAMYREMANLPELKGKPVQISLESRMGCGRGICYACTIRTRQGLKQVCHDGPVFELNDIIWDEMSLGV